MFGPGHCCYTSIESSFSIFFFVCSKIYLNQARPVTVTLQLNVMLVDAGDAGRWLRLSLTERV